MNASRCTYVAAPDAKAAETLPSSAGQRRSADVIVEGEVSSDIEIAVINEHVIVERVVELGPELQVEAFGQSRFLRNLEIHNLVVRPSESRVDTRASARVSKRPSAPGARAIRLERSDGLKRRGIQQ